MTNIWKDTTNLGEYPKLTVKKKCDVVVIGGGITGLLVAYKLQKSNKQVILLEANTIASGQSSKTTAKITYLHNLIYDSMIKNVSLQGAKQYVDANKQTIDEYEEIINELKIDCDFKRCSSVLYTHLDTNKILKEKKALDQLNIDSTIVHEIEIPIDIKAGLKVDNQAVFNPLKFMDGLSKELNIYENSKVIKVEDNVVYTKEGEVEATQIVFATHFPIRDVPGFYFLRMHQERSYVVAISNVANIKDTYYCIDKDTLSFRGYDNSILVGGEKHRTGENSKGNRYKKLTDKAKAIWPNCKVECEWSAQDCMSIDKIPYIGQYSKGKPNWYVASGYNKWGMTTSLVAANIITNMICDIDYSKYDVFNSLRFNVKASYKDMYEQTRQTIKAVYRENLVLPNDTLDQLPRGHGGIIDYDNNKIGVYKDENDEYYLVNTRCPHLGCQLEWNPDDLSWDCPCHGSRFSYKGELIDNPAQEDLNEKG